MNPQNRGLHPTPTGRPSTRTPHTSPKTPLETLVQPPPTRDKIPVPKHPLRRDKKGPQQAPKTAPKPPEIFGTPNSLILYLYP